MGDDARSHHDPLQVTLPSVSTVLYYPLLATNVRILCEKDGWRARGGILATLRAVRLVHETEGVVGLFQSGETYLLHQAAREGLKHFIGQIIDQVPSWIRLLNQDGTKNDENDKGKDKEDAVVERSLRRQRFWWRVAAKYAIDALCYPILMASTRGIILKSAPLEVVRSLPHWCQLEGPFSIWRGLTCHLLSQAADEALEVAVGTCIANVSGGGDLALADQLLIKASAMSVLGVLTTPISHIGIIQRCQSSEISGLVECKPVSEIASSLPWKGLFLQLVLFSGLLFLNVKVLQAKLELEIDENQQQQRQRHPRPGERRPPVIQEE